MELNPWIKNFETSLAGKTIKVPTSYAKKSTIYINQTNFYPIFQEMYDDKGLYEKYEYSGLKVNPVFKADEFTEDFSEYNF
jgi:outer membrane lipoprotein-sorting protein